MYLVLRHYAERYAADPEFACNQIDRLRVFAGFGTISDRMPMLYENRQLVKDTLEICRMVYHDGYSDTIDDVVGCEEIRRAFSGLRIMLTAFAEKKAIDINTIREDFIGYYVAPTFNSIKRMNGTVETAYTVFFGREYDAHKSMEQLMEMNEKRKELVDSKYTEMRSEPSPNAPFLYVVDTYPGVCGLLAQKVCDDSGYPAVVVIKTDKEYRGSGRSPEWYPFLQYANNRDQDWEAAGHEGAFGIRFKNAAALDAYADFIKKDAERRKPVSQKQSDLVISTLGGGDTDIDMDLFSDFLTELKHYEPFGPEFEAPSVTLRFDPNKCRWALTADGKHVRVSFPHEFVLVCWNQGNSFNEKIDRKLFEDEIEAIGKLEFNTYNGETTVQLKGMLSKEALESYQDESLSSSLHDEECSNERETCKSPVIYHEYKVKGEKHTAWEIQSQCVHNGKDVWTETIVQQFINALLEEDAGNGKPRLIRYAWCNHNKDKYREENIQALRERGELTTQKVGDDRPAHIHLMLEFQYAVYNTSLYKKLQRFTTLDIRCIHKPEALSAQFMAMATYLTHCRALEYLAKGKHRYSDDEVHCNFDYRAAVNQYLIARERAQTKHQKNLRSAANSMIDRIENGQLTIEEAKVESKERGGYGFFLRHEKEFRSARTEYIKKKHEMLPRTNYFICGSGGSGKSTLSKWLARSLFPEYEDSECFYVAGAKGVRFDDYEYQPVIIWEDVRADELLKEYKREDLLNLMELSPKKRSYNIKFGKVILTHQVNIFTYPYTFNEFTDALMGKQSVNGEAMREERDKEQLWRRFPVVIILDNKKNKIIIKRNQSIYDGEKCSKFKEYCEINNVNIGAWNRELDGEALKKAFETICAPIVNLHKKYMESRSSKNKYSEEFFSPDDIEVLEGYDVLKDEKERHGANAYHSVCEKMLESFRLSLEDEEFGPYVSQEGWQLGDILKGKYDGLRCPLTYEQWQKMGEPKKWDYYEFVFPEEAAMENGETNETGDDQTYHESELIKENREYQERFNRIQARSDEIREYLLAKRQGGIAELPNGITSDDVNDYLATLEEDEFNKIMGIDPEEIVEEPSDDPDWTSDYVNMLEEETKRLLINLDQEHLKSWIHNLFGGYDYKEIKDNEKTLECLERCWRRVRDACIGKRIVRDKKEWYSLYQELNSQIVNEY